MKVNKETHPVRALETNRFRTFAGPNIGSPLLLNHKNDNIEIMTHLVNAISKRGIACAAITKNKTDQLEAKLAATNNAKMESSNISKSL